MDLHEYIELIALALWVACIVGIGILSRLHFKNKKLEQFRSTANKLMKNYLSFYDQENLSEEKKINRIANAVVAGLQAKGFKVSEQDVEEIFAGVAKIIEEKETTQQKKKLTFMEVKMRYINPTTSVDVEKSFEVSTGHGSVIQKGNVTKSNIYALQLWNNQEQIRVYKGSISDPKHLNILKFKGDGSAGHHTQTWEYSGKKDNWFIGTKPVNNWCSQIARVDIASDVVNHNSNLDFTRIAWLSHAGNMDYSGSDMVRSEAAVSPNYEKLLIATIDKYGTGYFSIYRLSQVNEALNKVKSLSPKERYVKINDLSDALDSSFKVSEFYSKDANSYDDFILNSVQGYDLDNEGNIYVTSQQSPNIDKKTGKFKAHHKQILKIPVNARNDSSRWSTLDLSAAGIIDIKGQGLHSEVESIQIIDENYAYLTVAYHEARGTKPNYYSYTSKNIIYKIRWYE